jgi:2,4-dienoyl-CoA reductase-like NADH-dependent reductase (Old Yellow Enzyme family)
MTAESQMADSTAHLFAPLRLRGVTLKNRVMVAPMAMYSAHEGFTDDFHLVHLGRFALGGAGLVFTEATAVSPAGRITPGCAGLWLDAQGTALRRLTDFLHRHDCAAGIQLAHSGPRGATRRPWHGGTRLDTDDLERRREQEWPIVGVTADPYDAASPPPHALTAADLDALVEDYRRATLRAVTAGFDVLELHFAHGYLMHAFLSPLTNRRDDDYGGGLENRMRLPLRVVEAVRAGWPADRPLFVRISAIDGVEVGWSLDDSVSFAKELAARGVDAVDCSSGGMVLPRDKQLASRTLGFQVPFAARIRREAQVATVAVGLIIAPKQAESILRSGDADLVALAREALVNPNWAAQAALELTEDKGWSLWPEPFRWWLERRARTLAKLRAAER